MTWFLKPDRDAPDDAVPALEGQIPSRWQQAVGARTHERLRSDRWVERSYANDLEQQMIDALGGQRAAYPADADGIREFLNPQTRGNYLSRRIAERRAADPEFGSGLPASEDEFRDMVRASHQADIDANQAMLDRGDSWWSKLAGGIIGGVLTPENLALAPLGGPVSQAGRFILTEAALGAASELPGAMQERSLSERLDIEPAPVGERLAMGAAGGAAFGGAISGVAALYRGVRGVRGRRVAEAEARPDGVSGADWQSGIDAAEADLRMGREPGPAPDVMRAAAPDASMGRVIDDGYYAAIRSAESGGNDAARNPRSTATGRYQFTQGTWNDLRRQHPDLGLTADGRLDPAQQEIAIRAFTEANAAGLREAGVPVTRGNLYAAHFLGLGDARRVLRAGADVRMTDLLSPAVIEANPFLRAMRVSDFRAWTIRKTGNAPGGGGAADFPDGPMAGRTDGTTTTRRSDWFSEVFTPAGTAIDVRYRVVDLSDLHAARGDFQPRDRSRAASDEQIAEIARDLRAARLMPSPESTSGAPIIGPDRMVESGNGRVAALARAAEQHPDRYQAYVRAIEDAGFEVPDGVSRPVLVAERLTDMDDGARRQFVRESNTSGIARMAASEQARVDADYLTPHAFDGFAFGRGLNSPENAEFVRRVFAAMPQAERAGLMTAEGRLNIDGLRRLRQSMFARAFDADDLLKLLAETEHPAALNMLRMLEDIAPDWAAFRAMIDAGYIRAEFDITEPLMDMVRIITRARIEPREGQSVIGAIRDRLAQDDMFGTRDNDMAEALIGIFYRGDSARSPTATGSILTRYMHEADNVGRADMDSILGAQARVTPAEVLREAARAQDARAPMPDLPDAPAQPASAPLADQPDIRALDSLNTTEGVQSPALARATDTELREMKEARSTGDAEASAGSLDLLNEIAARDPDISAALARQAEIPLTSDLAGYGTDAFWQQRIYRAHDATELLGRDAAVDYLVGVSRRLAWSEEGLPPGPIRSERRATILIGPPAAGKSTVANPLARERGAAIVDADEAKNLIPEYGRGEGANAVHDESGKIADRALRALMKGGGNLVLPKVGGKAGSIERTINLLKRAGYRVDLVEVVTPPGMAIERMLGRFKATGRIIPPQIMAEGIDGAPATYQLLKQKGIADAYAQIDNAPGLGQPRGILEDDEGILHAFAGRDRGNRNAQPRRAGTASDRGRDHQARITGSDTAAIAAPDAAPDAAADAIASARAALEVDPDLTLRMGDGPDAPEVRLADILDDLDQDSALTRAMTSCNLKGVPA